MLANRWQQNEEIISSLKENAYSEDLLTDAVKDAGYGAMGPVVLVEELDLDVVTVSRRVAVREQREAGWRTRSVYNMTVSGMKPSDSCRCEDHPRFA